MKKRVWIKLKDGTEAPYTGDVFGPFVVIRTVDGWSVTHIDTGLSVGIFRANKWKPEMRARMLAKQISESGINWNIKSGSELSESDRALARSIRAEYFNET